MKDDCFKAIGPVPCEKAKKAQIDILLWAMQLCGSGMTTGMIRKALHNKLVEITGEGEKA